MRDCAEDFNNGQNDVTDGSVENYDFNWNEAEQSPPQGEDAPGQTAPDPLPEQGQTELLTAALDETDEIEDNKQD